MQTDFAFGVTIQEVCKKKKPHILRKIKNAIRNEMEK